MSQRGRFRRGTRFLFALATAMGVAFAVEVLAHLTYLVRYGTHYSPSHVTRLAEAPGATDSEPISGRDQSDSPGDSREILHPYLGYVRSGNPFDTHGLPSRHAAIQSRRTDRLVVAVVGGSVARRATGNIERRLAAVLEQRHESVELVLLTLGLAGYKQPQQLLLVSYLLSLGGEFDLVINIDGYNEVVLPIKDNYQYRTYPFFPRWWKGRLSSLGDSEGLAALGKVRYLQEELSRTNSSFAANPLRYSALYGSWSAVRLDRLRRSAVAAEQEIMNGHDGSPTFESTGPWTSYDDLGQLAADSAAVWRRSSLALHRLAESYGFEYYHVLQPNQYFEGSKPLSAAERRTAYEPESERAAYASQGYPLLVEESRQLVQEGVRFVDATQLFAGEEQTLYLDVCCHYNRRGNDLLAEYVVDQVLTSTKLAQLRIE